jgi:hypothetical protein
LNLDILLLDRALETLAGFDGAESEGRRDAVFRRPVGGELPNELISAGFCRMRFFGYKNVNKASCVGDQVIIS